MQPGSHNDLYHRVLFSAVLERTERLHKEAAHAADVAEARRYRECHQLESPQNLRQKLGYTLIGWGQKLAGETALVPHKVNS